MNIKVGDLLEMKKPHPCGCNIFLTTRVGMDFKIQCTGCGHLVMSPRSKIEKGIKKVLPKEQKEQ